MTTIVHGIEALERKFKALPASVKAACHDANDKNADEFIAKVLSIIPRGGPEPGKLAGTIEKGPGKTDTAVKVSIGGPAAPYPAHLEFGHVGPGGVHVQAEPFWFPAMRVLRKRFRARTARAGNAAIKKVAAGGG